MPQFHIYYSTYVVIWGFLYLMKIVKYNPLSWLIITLLISITIMLYLIYNNVSINIIKKIIIYNSPKLILLCLIDYKNICNGFIIGIVFLIYYLIMIDFNIKDIYYNRTIKKIIDSKF
jgi:hypothetical protein